MTRMYNVHTSSQFMKKGFEKIQWSMCILTKIIAAAFQCQRSVKSAHRRSSHPNSTNLRKNKNIKISNFSENICDKQISQPIDFFFNCATSELLVLALSFQLILDLPSLLNQHFRDIK
jgi:hypothetical protein